MRSCTVSGLRMIVRPRPIDFDESGPSGPGHAGHKYKKVNFVNKSEGPPYMNFKTREMTKMAL